VCGRYSITTAPEAMRQLFDFANQPNLAPRYNVAPTQTAPVLRLDPESGGRVLVQLRWGLVPSWSKDATGAAKMINARAETAHEKPAFHAAFRARRCLVPADGFYEWRLEDGKKQPFRIGLKGGATFAFAGLWESWSPAGPKDPAAALETFTILTTEANAKLAPIHERMPVMLASEAHAAWLEPASPIEALRRLLVPFPAEPMAFYRVSARVNNVRNDDADCIRPLNPKPA